MTTSHGIEAEDTLHGRSFPDEIIAPSVVTATPRPPLGCTTESTFSRLRDQIVSNKLTTIIRL